MILSCSFCSLPYWVNTVFSTHIGSFTIQIFYLLLSYLMALPLCLEQSLQGYKSNIYLVSPTHSDLSPSLKTPTLSGDLGMAHAAQEEFVEASVDLEAPSACLWADLEAVPSPSVAGSHGELPSYAGTPRGKPCRRGCRNLCHYICTECLPRHWMKNFSSQGICGTLCCYFPWFCSLF